MPRSELKVDIEDILDDMDRFVAREIVSLTFEIHAELVESTPLDLGWARANFVPQIATPYRENLRDAEPSSGAANNRASANISRLGRIAASYRLGNGPLFISNNVPYIGRLNDGHSKQAPPGYIPMAVDRAVETRKRL